MTIPSLINQTTESTTLRWSRRAALILANLDDGMCQATSNVVNGPSCRTDCEALFAHIWKTCPASRCALWVCCPSICDTAVRDNLPMTSAINHTTSYSTNNQQRSPHAADDHNNLVLITAIGCPPIYPCNLLMITTTCRGLQQITARPHNRSLTTAMGCCNYVVSRTHLPLQASSC